MTLGTTSFKLLAILARAAMPPGQCGCLPCSHFPAEGVYVERQDDSVYVVALDEKGLPNLKVLSTYEYEAVVGTVPQLEYCSLHSPHILSTAECPPQYTPDDLTVTENSPCRFDMTSMPSPPAMPVDATPPDILEYLPLDLLSITDDNPSRVALSTPLPPASPRRAITTPKKAVKSPKVVSSTKIARSRPRQSLSQSKDAILRRKSSSASVSLPGSVSDTNVIVLKRSRCAQTSKSRIEYWAILDKIFELVVTKLPRRWAESLHSRYFSYESVDAISHYFNNRSQNWGSVNSNPVLKGVKFSRPQPTGVVEEALDMRLHAIRWSTTWTDEEFVTFVEDEILRYKDKIIQEYVQKADTIPGFGNRLNLRVIREVAKYAKKEEVMFFPRLKQTLTVLTMVPTKPMPSFVFAAK